MLLWNGGMGRRGSKVHPACFTKNAGESSRGGKYLTIKKKKKKKHSLLFVAYDRMVSVRRRENGKIGEET